MRIRRVKILLPPHMRSTAALDARQIAAALAATLAENNHGGSNVSIALTSLEGSAQQLTSALSSKAASTARRT
jgi:hypothetical protein